MTALGWRYLTSRDREEILGSIAGGETPRAPKHVEIHPADRCNIDCFFCSTAAIRGTDEMPLRTFPDFLAELKRGGTRSLRLSGGGEPLFHRQVKPFLKAIVDSGLRIENITTNGVLMGEEVTSLLAQCCDSVTLSLNTADSESWAEMMRSPARNFERVLTNARDLTSRRPPRPELNVQFLVWKKNYGTIQRMYELAREIGADSMFFSGLSFLQDRDKMSATETDEMMELYREVVRRDGYRRISIINSLEQDLRPRVDAMNAELHRDRISTPLRTRLRRFVKGEFGLQENVRNHLRSRKLRKTARMNAGFDQPCIIGWYSMVVRTNGEVGPCCILQGKSLGNVYRQSIDEVWRGAPYEQFRGELRRIMRARADWQPGQDQIVEAICGGRTASCPISGFYFHEDPPFVRRLDSVLRAMG